MPDFPNLSWVWLITSQLAACHRTLSLSVRVFEIADFHGLDFCNTNAKYYSGILAGKPAACICMGSIQRVGASWETDNYIMNKGFVTPACSRAKLGYDRLNASSECRLTKVREDYYFVLPAMTENKGALQKQGDKAISLGGYLELLFRRRYWHLRAARRSDRARSPRRFSHP